MLTSEFVTAGRAVFTIELPAAFSAEHDCPPHYTFRVSKKAATAQYAEAYFVGLLTGADNENDFSYLGMLNAATGEVRLTAKSRMTEDAWPVRIIRRVLARLWAGEADAIEAAGWRLHHEGRCGRCGRTLTVPASVESGIGPECAAKMAAA